MSAGARSASAARSSGRIGSIIGWCDGTSILTLRANVFCCRGKGDDRRQSPAVGPAITVWRGEAYTVTVTSRVAGDQRLGRLGVELHQRHRARARRTGTSTATGSAITRNPSAAVSAPATTAALTSPIECPMTASGSTP